MRKFLSYPIAPLLLFSLALAALLVTYLSVGLTPSPEFEVVAAFFWSVLLALWIVNDCRYRSGLPCFDFGLLCYLFLPIAVPWYCLWSRGVRGLLMLFAIVVLWIAPYVLASVFWIFWYG